MSSFRQRPLGRVRGGLLFLGLLTTTPAVTHASAANPPVDAARLPVGRTPPLVGPPSATPPTAALGYGGALAQLEARDRRRRLHKTAPPADFGHTLRPGENFRFDVTFAGNPAGLATAAVIEQVEDPRGAPPAGAPMVRLVGHARTSGVVSLLATVTDDIEALLDARTGAPVTSTNVIDYKGLRVKYRHRVTRTDFHGRGYVRLEDRKDDAIRTQAKRVPADTLDPLAAMAWVRSLRLQKGETARGHAMDGTALLRVEILSRGRKAPQVMPPIAASLGIEPDSIEMIEGVLTRVDGHDRPLPDRKRYSLRAFLTTDHRRLPLLMETNMWVGSIRLELVGYDPPRTAGSKPRQRSPD